MTRPEAKFSWFVPIDGDGAHIGTIRAERPPTFEYLSEVVRTAEDEGFYSLLIRRGSPMGCSTRASRWPRPGRRPRRSRR